MLSGCDERRRRKPYIPEGRHDDFFDWSFDEGAPVKVDCLDRICNADPRITIDNPYWPWGCWFCDHLRLTTIISIGREMTIGACELGHPTFYYIGFRRNNPMSANRRYVTAYRTMGEDDDVRQR